MEFAEYNEMRERFLSTRRDDIRKYLKAEKERFCKEEQAERWNRFDFTKTVIWTMLLCVGFYFLVIRRRIFDWANLDVVLLCVLVATWIWELVKTEQRFAAEDVFLYHEQARCLDRFLVDHTEEILAEAETPAERERLREFIDLSRLYLYHPNGGWDFYVH